MKLVVAVCGLVLCYGLMAVAQVPAVAPVAASGSWLSELVASKGGFMGLVILIMSCFNVLVSALRDILCKWDGVNLNVPSELENNKGASFLNKLALVSGKILDYVQGNTQHK